MNDRQRHSIFPFGRPFGLLLLFFCLTLLLSFPVLAGKPSLSAKSVTLYRDCSYILRIRNGKGRKPVWKSQNPGVVLVTPLSDGSARLRARGRAGTAVVTARIAGRTLKCKVRVRAWKARLTKGAVIPASGTTAFVFPSALKVSAFSSSDKKVASVTKKGKIRGRKPGSCRISYRVGGKLYSMKITVTKPDSSAANGPALKLGTFLYTAGGKAQPVYATAAPGGIASLSLKNSAAGMLYEFCFFVNGALRTEGLHFTSSNTQVLSYSGMEGSWVRFYSRTAGCTELNVSLDGHSYRFDIGIVDPSVETCREKRAAILTEAGIRPGMAEPYICFLLASYISDHVTYDPVGNNPDPSKWRIGVNSSYKDYFRGNKLVCSGYSDLYMFLLDAAGIECRQVDSSTMQHRWNQVKTGGVWYNVDIAWMDAEISGQYAMPYFLVSDACMLRFSEGRHLAADAFKCTSTRFDACLDEQLKEKNRYHAGQYSELTPADTRFSPWVTGSWQSFAE